MSQEMLEPLVVALMEGEEEEALQEVEVLLAQGVSDEEIVVGGVEEALTRLDNRCTLDQYNLLEIMLVGRSALQIMKRLYPVQPPPSWNKGTVVLAALQGDIHDLGKNIFKTILLARGYHVLDGGKDRAIEEVITLAQGEGAAAIGVSGLLATIIPQVQQLREEAHRRGLHQVKVFAGGVALRRLTSEILRVDFVASDAFDGARYLDRVLGAA